MPPPNIPIALCSSLERSSQVGWAKLVLLPFTGWKQKGTEGADLLEGERERERKLEGERGANSRRERKWRAQPVGPFLGSMHPSSSPEGEDCFQGCFRGALMNSAWKSWQALLEGRTNGSNESWEEGWTSKNPTQTNLTWNAVCPTFGNTQFAIFIF